MKIVLDLNADEQLRLIVLLALGLTHQSVHRRIGVSESDIQLVRKIEAVIAEAN